MFHKEHNICGFLSAYSSEKGSSLKGKHLLPVFERWSLRKTQNKNTEILRPTITKHRMYKAADKGLYT